MTGYGHRFRSCLRPASGPHWLFHPPRRAGGGAPGTGTTGGGGGSLKLQRGAQRRRGIARRPGAEGRGEEARAGGGWLKLKECREGGCR
jgi:hypothetical protein